MSIVQEYTNLSPESAGNSFLPEGPKGPKGDKLIHAPEGDNFVYS